jgi:hypothetical protein
VRNPVSQTPGTTMPPFDLPARDSGLLVSYLLALPPE